MPQRTCSIPGCDRPHQARGWCKLHYERWRKTGTTDDPFGPRICRVCGEPSVGRGLCRRHYQRERIHGGTETPHPEKGSPNPSIHLTASQLAILDGEMLGDGCLFRRNPRQNAHLSWSLHSRQHIDMLAAVFAAYDARVRPVRGSDRWTLRTLSNPALSLQRDRWYPDGVKRPPEDLMLTSTVCLHWFLGDGANRGGGALRLHTEGFAVTEVEWLAERLRGLGFACALRFRSYRGDVSRPFIALGARAGRGFLAYIGECPLEDYRHRWES